MKPIITVLISVIACKGSISQTIKNFDSSYYNGTARFQYYEGKQNEMILNGKFSFSQKGTITETGTFSDNLKVGQWDYVYKENKECVRVSGRYEADLKNGIWNSTLTDATAKTKYILNYKNDTLVGKVAIDGLTGQFTTDGKYIGDWKMECDDYLYKAKFVDNILVRLAKERLTDHRLVRNYEPDISNIDFLRLGDEANYIVRKEYNLVGITRVLVDDFQTSRVYGVPDYDEKLQEELFYDFFDCLESRIEDFLFIGKGWNLLKFTLINNPDFLYLAEPTEEIYNDKKKKRKEFERKYGPVVEYDQVDRQPAYSGGTDSLIKFIISNYRNAGNVSGRLFIDGIIASDGKLHIIMTTCSGNLVCDEINRILNLSPSWEPAKQNGKNVNVKVSLPVFIQKLYRE